ncbi:MAG: gliding motility-associated C-terminal domain-containing protein [Crocinitomicaceae bacterium]|nr:gliding motility-associated C-terminal domain-containing protein [Crocinitomicaceae bacterium]
MKGNNNIEELFKQKFDGFQADVNPQIWANIQAGLGTTAAVTTGVSVGVKIGLITGGIAAASLATWYFGSYEPAGETAKTENTIIADTQNSEPQNTTGETIIYVADENDPAIIENKEQIENELKNHQNQNNVTSNTQVSQAPNNGTTNDSQNTNNNTGNNEVTTSNQQDAQVLQNNQAQDPQSVESTPNARMEYSQSNVFAPSVITFNSNASDYKEVRWDFGDGTLANGAETKHTFSKAGVYKVTMTVIGKGKVNYQESQEITVKSKSSIDNIPNVITPNGDRINDYFSVKSTDIETFQITITDQRGNEIFASNDTEFVWDGTNYDGQTVDRGMYYYVIIAEGKDGSVIKLPGQIYVQ